MGITKQVHLILVVAVVTVSSLVLAVASPVPYGGRRATNWTAPSMLAATAAEEFLMESGTSQIVLNDFFGTTTRSGDSGKPVVTCGVVGYRACLPDANGRKPKQCDALTRECVY